MTPPLATLTGHKTITNVDADVPNLDARQVVMGPDASGLGLQVLICDWTGPGSPNVTAMRKAHANRVGNRIFPCVVATVDDDHVWLVGPAPDAPPVGPIPISQAERVLQAALDEPTGLQARQRLSHLLDSVRSTDIAGMTNAGLFATHYLTEGVRDEDGWPDASTTARPWLKLRGEPLITAMGFTVKSTKANAHILTTEGHNQPRAVAVLLNESEAFEADSPRFAVSPVRFGLNVAQREDAPWLIVLRGSQVRLYAARPGVGVGSRGQAETFFELDLALFWTKPTRDISNMRSRLMPYATMGWSNGSSLGLSGTPRGWGVAEILHGDFRQSDYPKVVRLLLLVLRRLDCVPELVKSLVLVRFTDLGDHVANRESLLAATTREQSHHTSPMMMCGQLVIPVGLGP